MRILKFAASLLLIALASGCSTTEPLIADKFLLISPSVQIFYEALAGATLASAVIWYVADPMAPICGAPAASLRKRTAMPPALSFPTPKASNPAH